MRNWQTCCVCSLVVAYGAGYAVGREGRTRAACGAHKECSNPCCTMPVIAYRTAYIYCEHRCALKPAREKSVNRRWMHGMSHKKLTEGQVTRTSTVGGLAWCDSTRNNAHKHFLQHDLKVSISSRDYPTPPKRPAALSSEKFGGSPFAASVGIVLER